MVIEVAGVHLVARADKSLYWPEERTLFVADLHLGKGAAFRAGNVPIPPGSTAATLEGLSKALLETSASKLVVLGDMWHSREGRDAGTRLRFGEWRRSHSEIAMQLVVGNHDRRSGPLEGEGFDVATDEVRQGPFRLVHEPCEDEGSPYTLSGHIHPAVTLEGKGRQAVRLPCFWFGRACGVLPSFGWFTGSAEVRPRPADQVLVIAEGRVIRVPT